MTLKWHGYAALALVITFGATPAARGQKMYWSTGGGVLRANLDGSDVVTIVAGETTNDIALDLVNNKLYWINENASTIRRADLDGSNREDIVTNVLATNIDIHDGLGAIYWTQNGPGFFGVRRANLDGSGIEDLATVQSQTRAIYVDSTGGALYWGDGPRVMRGDINGANPQQLPLPEFDIVAAIAVDTTDSKIYWSSLDLTFFFFNAVARADLDGGNVEDLGFDFRLASYGLALDAPRALLYLVIDSAVVRTNLDGSQQELLHTSGGLFRGIELDPRVPVIPAISPIGLLLLFVGLAVLGARYARRPQATDIRGRHAR